MKQLLQPERKLKEFIQRHKILMFSIIAICISLTVTFAIGELLLRFTGHPPWKYKRIYKYTYPAMYEYDPELGWKHKEGKHLISAYKDITVTFLPGDMRFSGTAKLDDRDKVVIVGGSFTMGYGISDDETYPWKLQSKYPSVQVLNYGTSGYGTYQSLLALERIIPDMDPPLMVLYGFIGQHEIRNVAHSGWLRHLSLGGKVVGTPYCTIDSNDTLIRHPLESYPVWPLREHLATVNSLQILYTKFKTKERVSQKETVTEALLLEMRNFCLENGSKFTVVLLALREEKKSHYIKFFRNNHINFIDCVHPKTPEMLLPVDNIHPNGKMNTLFANCIGEAIEDTIIQFGIQ